MLSPASPPGPALGPVLREGLKPGPGPSPTFKARARPELVFLGPDPSLLIAQNLKTCSTIATRHIWLNLFKQSLSLNSFRITL